MYMFACVDILCSLPQMRFQLHEAYKNILHQYIVAYICIHVLGSILQYVCVCL